MLLVLYDFVSPIQDERVKVYIVIYEEANVAEFKIVQNGGKISKEVFTQPNTPTLRYSYKTQ